MVGVGKTTLAGYNKDQIDNLKKEVGTLKRDNAKNKKALAEKMKGGVAGLREEREKENKAQPQTRRKLGK